jgi:hypothetical protein
VLKNSPRPKPLLIRLDGNLRNSYWTEFIKKILEYWMSPEYSDIVKGILQVTYWFTADSSYFKKMLDFEWITEEQFSREKVRDKPIWFFSNPLFKLLNEETWFNI